MSDVRWWFGNRNGIGQYTATMSDSLMWHLQSLGYLVRRVAADGSMGPVEGVKASPLETPAAPSALHAVIPAVRRWR